MEFKKPARSHTQKKPQRTATDTPQTPELKVIDDKASIAQLLFAVLKDKITLVIIAGVIVIIIVAFATFTILRQSGANKQPTDISKQDSTTKEKPKYDTVLPESKSVDTLGGWIRISPPENDPVYAFLDKIGETPISVSEQPLPESFKGDTDGQLAELAKKFNATSKIEAGNVAVYSGVSAKGPQSVIFTKNNLLIFIKSQNKIDDAAWKKYIESLQ